VHCIAHHVMHCGYYGCTTVPVLRKSSAVAFQVVPVISLNEVDMESVPKLLLSPCTPAQGRDAAQYGMRSGCGWRMAQPDVVVL
jgi:hypothetical protein